jgi:hypothetical protein
MSALIDQGVARGRIKRLDCGIGYPEGTSVARNEPSGALLAVSVLTQPAESFPRASAQHLGQWRLVPH